MGEGRENTQAIGHKYTHGCLARAAQSTVLKFSRFFFFSTGCCVCFWVSRYDGRLQSPNMHLLNALIED